MSGRAQNDDARRDPTNLADAAPPGALDEAPKEPKDGTGLCLSGGGYRAMMFHTGVLWRLYEAGLLKGIARVSSVSGGSLAAGALAIAWGRLGLDPGRLREDFVPLVVEPLRGMAGHTVDANSVLGGMFMPGTVADHVAGRLDEALFRGATLQDLPDSPPGPRFVINATNVQTGSLWRFSKPYMGDWQVGLVRNPELPLAAAVAASAAYPPVLSPMSVRLDPEAVEPFDGAALHEEPYTSRVVLTDGGVYDNLGLETVWKNYRTVLVSDGGQRIAPEPEPHSDWARHAHRVFGVVDNQVRSLRKRQVVGSFKDGTRKGAYWSIRSRAGDFPSGTPLPCPPERTAELAAVPTRLERMPAGLQERLINWGYAACDLGLRSHPYPDLPPPAAFPYPRSGV